MEQAISAPTPHPWHPYCGLAPRPDEWLSRWNFDPALLAALVVVALAWSFAIGRTDPRLHIPFAGAMGLLLILFVSPLCALTSALFSARVVHHVLLTAAAAPLLVFAIPRAGVRVNGSLAFWTAAQAMIFWAWHAPDPYSLALSSDVIYWIMQLTLLGSAVGFWAVVRRSSEPAAVAALLATMVQMGLLGALITFNNAPLYAPHVGTTEAWGLTQLQDQQLAGLIMWVPAAAVYLVAALAIANRMLKTEGRAAA